MTSITISVFGAAVFGWLLLLTVLRFTVSNRIPQAFEPSRERLGYWWSLAVFALLVFLFGRLPLVLGASLLSFFGLKEYFTALPTRKADRHAMLLSYVSIPFVQLFVYIAWYEMFVLAVPVYVFLLLPVVLSLEEDRTGILLSLGRIAFGVMLLVYCLGYASYLYVLSPAWFVSTLFLAEVGDNVQVPLSRLVSRGGFRLQPETGVRKNWIGVALSIVLLVPMCLLLGPLNGWPPVHCAGVGVLVAVLCLLGDIVFFSVRSDLGVAGPHALVPGRGMMLDRLRGVCYVSPVVFHYLRYFLT